MGRHYPVGLDLLGERAVVLGGDAEALDKAAKLARAGARVDVYAPDVLPGLRALAARRRVHWYARRFTRSDLRGARIVVLCERNPALAQDVRAWGREDGFWLCAIDDPAACDWVNMALVEAGPVVVALGSGGSAPGLLRRIRAGIDAGLDDRFAAFAERVAALREELRDLPPEERRRRMDEALEGFEIRVQVRYPPWESE